MSRTVNGEAWFQGKEREVLRKMIWQVAEFSGVKIITYAVMRNHFHLLVEVPPVDTPVSDAEIVRRFRALYPKPTPWQPMRASVLEKHLKSGSEEGDDLRRALIRRMHDISWMMKTLKQRFTLWFNRSRDRFGPVWCERFKSVLVEGDHWALKTVAAYIDLNAVRAGLVDDPKDYRFCGYGEALGGSRKAREGIAHIERDLAGYRQTLYGSGSGPREKKATIGRDEAVRVLQKEKGKLPLAVLLRCRIRYFSDGEALGSEGFVKDYLSTGDKMASPAKKFPKPMRGTDWKGLTVAQGLHKDLFS